MSKRDLTEQMPERVAYSFHQMLDTGLLWLINSAVFHPHGVALALDYGDGEDEPRGWSLTFAGEGEPWIFDPDDPTMSERFRAVQALIAECRKNGRAPTVATDDEAS